MKTKILIMFVLLLVFSIHAKAQLSNERYEIKLGEMGTFYIEFSETNYKLTNPRGDLMVTGTYKIEGATINFTDKEGLIACPDVNVGKYRFTRKDDQLKLELIEDECGGRSRMAAVPWKKIE